jgi:hypothetical protein
MQPSSAFLQAIERVLVLLEGHRSAPAGLQALAAAYESIGDGGKELTLVPGVSRHVLDACRQIVTTHGSDSLQPLQDAIDARSLKEWRAKWMPRAVTTLPPTSATPKQRPMDAATEADFVRGAVLDRR